MTASFTLVLDTQAPANPTLLINEGAAQTGSRTVWVRLDTSDYQAGANDVFQVMLWGDVDPTADPAIQPAEGDSQWLPFSEQLAVMLSSSGGRKYVYARLRDDVGNISLPFSDFIDFDSTVPMVTITMAVDRSRISKVVPHDAATFTWEASVPFSEYQVRVVPSHGSPAQAGVLILDSLSLNTHGAGTFAANTPITTTIRGADLQAASPGDTTKVVKVFIRDEQGVWSP